MSRIVKFRAWDVEDKQMIDIGEPAGIEWARGRGVKLVFGEAFHDDYIDGGIIKYELMQFTGLTDKNGREIYEGDVLSCSYDKPVRMRDEHVWPHEEFIVTPEDRKGEVYWADSSFKLFDHGTHDWMLIEVANVKKMAIIGNIYENVGLVPQEKIRRHLKIIY